MYTSALTRSKAQICDKRENEINKSLYKSIPVLDQLVCWCFHGWNLTGPDGVMLEKSWEGPLMMVNWMALPADLIIPLACICVRTLVGWLPIATMRSPARRWRSAGLPGCTFLTLSSAQKSLPPWSRNPQDVPGARWIWTTDCAMSSHFLRSIYL